MDISLDGAAAEFIRQRGGHLVLFEAPVTGCCGIGSAPELMMEVGRPRRSSEHYDSHLIDGVHIHADHAAPM